MPKLNELSRIITPQKEFIDYTNLFFHKERLTLSQKDNDLTNVYVYKFNTWMNIFASKKYFQYCVLNDLYLSIRLDKSAQIMVYGFNYNEISNNEDILYSGNIEANEIKDIKIENAEQYENIYFTLISEEENLNIQAFWGSTTAPQANNKLVLVSCTFKREKYIYNNVAKFKKFLEGNPTLKSRIEFYVVDNGRTLDKSIEDDNVKVFPNKNAGGAGGFTRGIIEAKNSGENFTRILLMDDDVEVFPESFYRTLVLSDYLKPEYRNAFIHGAMLDLYQKNMFLESTAIRTKSWCEPYHGELDISKPNEIAKANYAPVELFENEDKKVSSAWWYCCFSMESVQKNGLPLPVFFRCDDMEWSWRNFGEHHITMNGISVWHLPFKWRVSKTTWYYFSHRNKFMINMLHSKNYKSQMLKILRKDFRKLLKMDDYTSAEIFLRMMEDVLKGGDTFKTNPEKLLKEVSQYTKNDIVENATNLSILKDLKDKFLYYQSNKKSYKKLFFIIKKAVWAITNNGKLLPQCFWIKQVNTWKSSPVEEYLFCKKINVYNLATNKVEIRVYDRERNKLLNKKFKNLYQKIDKNYENIKRDYQICFEKFKTEEFWKKYLEI